jgi:hypothetical protein
MLRYNIRIVDDDRDYLDKLCQKLIAAGGASIGPEMSKPTTRPD